MCFVSEYVVGAGVDVGVVCISVVDAYTYVVVDDVDDIAVVGAGVVGSVV